MSGDQIHPATRAAAEINATGKTLFLCALIGLSIPALFIGLVVWGLA